MGTLPFKKMHFTDDNAAFTALELGIIPFISDAGLDKPIACFNKFIKGLRNVNAHAQVEDYNYLTPDHIIKAGQGPAANDPANVHYGLGTAHHDEAELWRQLGTRIVLQKQNYELKKR